MNKLGVIEITEGKDLKVENFRKLGVAKRKEKVKNATSVLGSIWVVETERGEKMVAHNINHSHKMRYTPKWIKEDGGKPEYYEQLSPSLWGWSSKIPRKNEYIEFKGYTSKELKKGYDKKDLPHKIEMKCKKVLRVKLNIYICEMESHKLAIIQVP